MTTVEEIDEKIEERKRQIAKFESRKKAMLAKEREQSRKWRAATITAVGEAVLSVAGCDWTQLDVAELHSWLDENSATVRSRLVTDKTSPAEAKERLDAYRHADVTVQDDGPEAREHDATDGPSSESRTW